jgi:phosphatidylserine/phosphatidylglycerophosphate/cardiolipin synthase-like enzyme
MQIMYNLNHTKTVVLFLLSLSLLIYPCSLKAAQSHHDLDNIITTDCHVTLLKDTNYFPVILDMIVKAQSEIVMSFFLFKTNGYRNSYPDTFLKHLIEAAQRGVKVRVILEKEKGPNSTLNENNRATAIRLRKGGVHVCFDSPFTTNHTKVIVIDRRYICLGSHNLTNSALKYNHEISVLIDSPPMAEKTLHYINSLYK